MKKQKKLKALHVVMTQDNKIWVFGSPSEVSYFLNGKKAKCKVSRSVDFLSRFLKENPDIVEDLPKAIGYWITCKFFRKKENELQYGKIKRELFNYGGKKEKLLKGVRSEIKKISREMERKLEHTEDKKPRYMRKRANSRPRV